MITYLEIPFPPPAPPGDPCDGCSGTGITDDRYEMKTDDGRVLLINVFCPACGGCGAAVHDGCGPHAGEDPADELEEEDDDSRVDLCLSCDGRGWNAVVAWSPAMADDAPPVWLRVPCGCMEHLAVTVELNEVTGA